jgi:hypothetical protein
MRGKNGAESAMWSSIFAYRWNAAEEADKFYFTMCENRTQKNE